MKKKFDGQVVLVTGASRGIGRAIAHEFAAEGAKLVLAARTPGGLADVEAEVRELGAEVLSIPTDITSGPALDALVEAILARFGRIDVLVNNAGIGRVGPVDAPTFAEDVMDTLQASLFGMIHLTRRVLPVFRAQGSGAIANMSSVMGRKAFARFGSYAIVMHAVSAYNDALRQELAGTGIRVSIIHPALTATDLIRDAEISAMPPPFRHMTPLTTAFVGHAVVRGVYHGQRRLVLPRMANLLLLAEAISPWLGDLVARALMVRPIAWLLGMSRGTTYHEAIRVRPRDPAVSAVGGLS